MAHTESEEEGGWEVAVRCGLMVATTGKYLFYYDAEAADDNTAAKCITLEGRPVRGVDVEVVDGTRWCFLAGDDKVLEVRDTATMEVKFKTNPFQKKLGKVRVSPQGTSVMVGDKTGEVFEIPFSTKSGLGEPKTVLAHMSSVITGLEFCHNGKLVATTDKDEHLRVSRYPQMEVIERFCFGHTAFISGLVKVTETMLATSGGDSQVRFWDIPSGKCVHADTHPSPVTSLAVFVRDGTPHVLAAVEGAGVFSYDTSNFEQRAQLLSRSPIAMQVGPRNTLFAAFIGETGPFLQRFSLPAAAPLPLPLPVEISSVKPSFWQLDLEKKRKLKAGEGTPADHARKRIKKAEEEAKEAS
eukprot:TRINITY_DN14307_c0_g1_i1.p1 TRINITY_DN14307_c0_g1~~TRINITY_DN14307_c0_g1_i1.p1  ORF type:complete len:355 (+),score=140.87 TRINITY_DN14307_c0_g1_i1:43-1107(+)